MFQAGPLHFFSETVYSFEMKHRPAADTYPYALKTALQESRFENILDANMFTAYIPRGADIPRFTDPRRNGAMNVGIFRQPGHVNFPHINQVFSCIGYIKRIQNLDNLKFLPVLYEELGRFLAVMEDVAYTLDIVLPQDIYEAHRRGFESFAGSYHTHRSKDVEWIEGVRKHQFLYLEKIDALIETLNARGCVFDHSGDPLYTAVASACRSAADGAPTGSGAPFDAGCRFVANCCTRAALSGQPKVVWSGDGQVLKLLRHIYTIPDICRTFPQVYLRSSYYPMDFAELFPKWHGKAA